MNQRLTKALGIAALGIAATGLFIPPAAAQSAPDLAPGLDCHQLQCTNSSNDTYVVDWDAICLAPGTDEPRAVVPTEDFIEPHEHKTLDATCPTGHRRNHPHDAVPGTVIDAHYKSATVLNLPPARPPTGSAL